MKAIGTIVIVLSVGFVVLCGYWLLNPDSAPEVFRQNMPEFKVPEANSPVKNFRAPQF